MTTDIAVAVPVKVKDAALAKWRWAQSILDNPHDDNGDVLRLYDNPGREEEEDHYRTFVQRDVGKGGPIYAWWHLEGDWKCSFCFHFKPDVSKRVDPCNGCPLHHSGEKSAGPCHSAWNTLHVLADDLEVDRITAACFEKVARVEVPRMLAAIEAVPVSEEE